MEITSKIGTDEKLFINQEDFDYDLKFIDPNSELFYLITKKDYNTDEEIAIMQGKLQGYYDGGDYLYRLDFSRFINIINNNIDWNSELYGWNSYEEAVEFNHILFRIIKENINKLNVYFTTGSTVLEQNYGNYITSINGKIIINNSLTSYYNFTSTFYDKYTSNLNPYPTVNNFYNNSWFALGCYNPQSTMVTYTVQYNSNMTPIYSNIYFGTDEGNLRQFFVYVKPNTKYIKIYTSEDMVGKTYTVLNKCVTPIYYWNDGVIDTIFCEGSKSEIDNVTKNTIKVNNKIVPISIDVQKQLKINTGYNTNDNQMLNFLRSPQYFISKDGYGDVDNPARNFMWSAGKQTINIEDTGSSFISQTTGYKGDNNAIQYIKSPNGHQYFKIAITDLPILYQEGYYYLTFWWKYVTDTNLYWDVFINYTYITTLYENSVQGTWKYFSDSFYLDELGEINIFLKPTFTSDSYCAVIISDLQFGFGNVPYPYSTSYNELGINKIKFDYYNLDDNNFESYNNKMLSETNKELLLTQNKTFKQNTNVKINFFD